MNAGPGYPPRKLARRLPAAASQREERMKKCIRHAILAAVASAGLALAPHVASAAPSGTFRFAEEVKLVTLDPHQHSGGGISYLRPVYESLFARTPDDKVVPFLATGYKQDGLKVKITLRNDVKFSDGTPFDASAVVANLKRGVKCGRARRPEADRGRRRRRRFHRHDHAQEAGPLPHPRPDERARHDDQPEGSRRSGARPQSGRHGTLSL